MRWGHSIPLIHEGQFSLWRKKTLGEPLSKYKKKARRSSSAQSQQSGFNNCGRRHEICCTRSRSDNKTIYLDDLLKCIPDVLLDNKLELCSFFFFCLFLNSDLRAQLPSKHPASTSWRLFSSTSSSRFHPEGENILKKDCHWFQVLLGIKSGPCVYISNIAQE